MKKEYNSFLVFALIFFMISCGVAHRLPQKQTIGSRSTEKEVNLPPALHASTYHKIQVSLKQAYRTWNGTPYEWGGTTGSGVDCSAFMQIVFNQYFGVEIPRNTRRQIYAGKEVNRKNLKPGDLIFFKTGRKTLHVGVIIEKPKFLHASTSQGVTISSLENYYWRSRFLTAKRILN